MKMEVTKIGPSQKPSDILTYYNLNENEKEETPINGHVGEHLLLLKT